VPDATAAALRLRSAELADELDKLCRRSDIRLLGLFGSAVRPPDSASEPNDLDVCVSFTHTGSNRRPSPSAVLRLLAELQDLASFHEVDLVLLDGADPVLRAEALGGVGLFEASPGAWAESQIAAIAERWDTAWLRRLDLEALAG